MSLLEPKCDDVFDTPSIVEEIETEVQMTSAADVAVFRYAPETVSLHAFQVAFLSDLISEGA